MSRWKDVDREELTTFFGFILLMDTIDEYYWKLDILYNFPLCHRIHMSYIRFTSILRCWHFAEYEPNNISRARKIDPIIKNSINRFRSLYATNKILLMNEPLVKFHGRHLIKTYKPSKASTYGFKEYKLCTVISYTWPNELYASASSQIEGLDKLSTVFIKL